MVVTMWQDAAELPCYSGRFEKVVHSMLVQLGERPRHEGRTYWLGIHPQDGHRYYGFTPDELLPGKNGEPDLCVEVTIAHKSSAQTLKRKRRKIQRLYELYGIRTLLLDLNGLKQVLGPKLDTPNLAVLAGLLAGCRQGQEGELLQAA